ncbi:MAG: hypothetical protein R3310_03005 [Candidatus Competibacteraceae bacterium]|nr:hypothetical protein [Candidatus Competibacteraceae bacterium]
MLSTLLITVLLTGVVAYWGLRYRTPIPRAPGSRSLSPAARNGERIPRTTPPRYWGVEMIVPDDCCRDAERFSHCRFPLDDAPSLPLAGCDRRCQCRLEYLLERRRATRPYHGPERRGDQRAMKERLEAPRVSCQRRSMAERL